jgi:hypothetical protein
MMNDLEHTLMMRCVFRQWAWRSATFFQPQLPQPEPVLSRGVELISHKIDVACIADCHLSASDESVAN